MGNMRNIQTGFIRRHKCYLGSLSISSHYGIAMDVRNQEIKCPCFTVEETET